MAVFPPVSGVVGRGLAALLLTLVALSGANLLPTWCVPRPLEEINSNLIGYYLVLQMIGVVLALFLWRKLGGLFAILLAGMLAALTLYHGHLIYRFFLPPIRADMSGIKIAALSADVEGDLAAMLNLSQQVSLTVPTVLAISGVTPLIASELPAKFSSMQVVAVEPRDDGFGLALLVHDFQVRDFTTNLGDPIEELPPVISAWIQKEGSAPLRIVALKLPAPLTKQSARRAEVISRRVFVPLRHFDGEYVVLGNLNATPTSTMYRRAWWATKARNAMEGHGYLRSCCLSNPLARFPINHILYGGNLVAANFMLLPSGGAQVSPVYAELILRP